MARGKLTCTEELVHAEFDAKQINQMAAKLGTIKRLRKVNAYTLVLTVVLTVATRGRVSIAGLRRSLHLRAGILMARSAFFDRLTAEFELLMKWLLDSIVNRARQREVELPKRLGRIRDVFVLDATVMKVDDSLRGLWKGCRNNSASAAIKVHTVVRALTGELLRYRITKEAYPDAKGIGTGSWMRGALILFDRGYPSPSLWGRIHRQGGFFLTRLPTGYDPALVGNNRRHRGRVRKIENRTLLQFVDGLQRKYLDVMADFRVYIRKYDTKHGHNERQHFRVVGVRNDKTRERHLYVANAPVEALPAEMIRDLYRLRWEVELFYEAAKSGSGMNELTTSQPHIVRTLVYAALIRTTLAMKAKMRASQAAKGRLWINPVQWMTVWNELLRQCLDKLLQPSRPRLEMGWLELAVLAQDPNRKRVPTRTRLGPSRIRLHRPCISAIRSRVGPCASCGVAAPSRCRRPPPGPRGRGGPRSCGAPGPAATAGRPGPARCAP